MSKKNSLLAAAVLLLLQYTAQVSAAAEMREIRLDPPANMQSASTVGMLTVCCDRTMSGCQFEVHLYQEEGDLLYYTFAAPCDEAVRVYCPLKKDGDYQLIVRVPQADRAELQPYCYPFSIRDPDPADHASDFDRTELIRYFSVDPTRAADEVKEQELTLKDRVYYGACHYTYARKAFLPGDANSDGIVNANDATCILLAAAALGVGRPTGLSSLEAAQSELNGDGILNAKDATEVLAYAAAIGVSAFSGNAAEFVRSRNMQ